MTKAPFQLFDIRDALDLDGLKVCFEAVPQDPWAPQRYKAISRVRVDGHRIERTAHGPLYQDTDLNGNVYGANTRDYPELDDGLLALSKPAIQMYAAFTDAGPQHELLVHAQRVVATGGEDGETGSPALEGFHQDGVWRIGMLVVARNNIYGGETLLALNDGGHRGAVIFSRLLEPGAFILFDDRAVFHNARRIHRMNPRDRAYRDVILIGFPSCRGPNEPRDHPQECGRSHAS